ncbi:MAG: S49 family peptidase [Alphaproteobacteria bacterium]
MWVDRLALRLGMPRPPVVPVVRLQGVIGGGGPGREGLTLSALVAHLDRAFGWPGAKAVALLINSPGGAAAQSALIAGRIRDLSAAKGLPVLAFVEDVAASGGYWLAAAGDEVYATEVSLVGSIGVIAAAFGFPEALRRLGVERRIHTAGERKSLWDPFLPEKPEDVARLSAIQADLHAAFAQWVRARRGERLKGDPAALFSGEVWVGEKALELGLVDGIGELRRTMRARFGEGVRLPIVNPERRRRWPRIGLAADPADWVGRALAAAEERATWARWGL